MIMNNVLCPLEIVRFIGGIMKKMLLVAVLFISSFFPVTIIGGQEQIKTRTDIPKAIDTITADELRDHIKFLASDDLHGRFSGSEDEKKVIEYISKEFKSYGLKPVGDNGGYYQKFALPPLRTVTEGTACDLTAGGETVHYKFGADFCTIGVSGAGSAEGKVVFAGYGITDAEASYDDYKDIDVKGKIVLIMRHSFAEAKGSDQSTDRNAYFSAKAKNAKKHGVAALLIVSDPNNHQGSDDKLLGMTEGLEQKVDFPVIHIKQKMAEKILAGSGKTLSDLQSEIDRNAKPVSRALDISASLKVTMKEEKRDGYNVVGFLPGTDEKLKDEIIVIGGHHDHVGLGYMGSMSGSIGEIHNGADDNASGSSGVMELAEAFASLEVKPKRSILFITFAGEEQGLLGSRHYITSPIFPLDKTVFMFNLDMVGRSQDNWISIAGIGTSPGLHELIEDVNKVTVKMQTGYAKGGAGPSDHASFYYANIPVLFFFSGFHDDYHAPTDDWEKINSAGEANIVKLVFAIAWNLAVRDEKIEFTPSEGEDMASKDGKSSPHGRQGSYLGVIPHDYTSTDGARIDGARNGSPAEKAGLKKGDVIVAVNGETVNDFGDLSDHLVKHKSGETITIKVLREGKTVELNATLGKRGGE